MYHAVSQFIIEKTACQITGPHPHTRHTPHINRHVSDVFDDVLNESNALRKHYLTPLYFSHFKNLVDILNGTWKPFTEGQFGFRLSLKPSPACLQMKQMKMKMGAKQGPSWDTDQTQGLILFPGMFWSSGVEFSSDQRSDNLHTDMVFLLRHKQHYVTHGRDIKSFGLYIVFVWPLSLFATSLAFQCLSVQAGNAQ